MPKLKDFFYWTIANGFACAAAWNWKHGYIYWAAMCFIGAVKIMFDSITVVEIR